MGRLYLQRMIEIPFGFVSLAAAKVDPAPFKKQIGGIVTRLDLLAVVVAGRVSVGFHQVKILIAFGAGDFTSTFEIVKGLAPFVLFTTCSSVRLGVFPVLIDRLGAVSFGEFEFEAFELYVTAKRKTLGKPFRWDFDNRVVKAIERRGVVG